MPRRDARIIQHCSAAALCTSARRHVLVFPAVYPVCPTYSCFFVRFQSNNNLEISTRCGQTIAEECPLPPPRVFALARREFSGARSCERDRRYLKISLYSVQYSVFSRGEFWDRVLSRFFRFFRFFRFPVDFRARRALEKSVPMRKRSAIFRNFCTFAKYSVFSMIFSREEFWKRVFFKFCLSLNFCRSSREKNFGKECSDAKEIGDI